MSGCLGQGSSGTAGDSPGRTADEAEDADGFSPPRVRHRSSWSMLARTSTPAKCSNARCFQVDAG